MNETMKDRVRSAI